MTFTTRGDCQFSAPPLVYGQGATNVTINQVCTPAGAPELNMVWIPSNQGTQYIDNSQYSPNFEPGTFPSVGPFAPNQNSYIWDGLAPGSLHFIRVNTGTPAGWIGSPSQTVLVRTDCLAAPPVSTATTTVPAATATPSATATPHP